RCPRSRAGDCCTGPTPRCTTPRAAAGPAGAPRSDRRAAVEAATRFASVTAVARERGRSPALDELGRRRVVVFLVVAVLAAVGVVLLYVFAVRTHTGRTIDAVAYEGRHAVRPRTTKATNDLLRTITTSSLAFLGSALFLVAL